MNRRTFLAGASAALAAGSAGCGFVRGEESLAFEADLARVADAPATSAGYDLAAVTDRTNERTFEAGGRSRSVTVTNRLANYEKQVDLGPLGDRRAASLTALATPQVSILGETFNPVADMSTAELADRIQDQFDAIDDLERVGESPVRILETETVQTKYAGRANVADGQEIDVYLHISEPVEHEDDLVLGFGGYPQRLPAEESNVVELLTEIEHPATEP